jgi:hypothetical protein
MEREFWAAFLRRAELRVVIWETEVREQLSRISELERHGQDSREARAWLVELEELLNHHVGHRDRLKAKVLECASPESETEPPALAEASKR